MQDLSFAAATSTLTTAQADRLDAVAQELDRLNEVVREAVDAGLSVELQRVSRHHSGQGCWGDQMAPAVVKCT